MECRDVGTQSNNISIRHQGFTCCSYSNTCIAGKVLQKQLKYRSPGLSAAAEESKGTMTHGITPAQHVVTSAKGLLDHSNGLPGKAQVAAGKKAKDFCQCKSVLRATKVPQPAEPVVPGALCTLGSISSPFWPSQEIPVDINVMYPELHQHHCHKLFPSGSHQHSGNL